jgi:hypothetical protein
LNTLLKCEQSRIVVGLTYVVWHPAGACAYVLYGVSASNANTDAAIAFDKNDMNSPEIAHAIAAPKAHVAGQK